MAPTLSTAWQGQHLVVLRDDQEIDRIDADEIQRVLLVCRNGGQNPGDLRFAIVETAQDHVILPAESGIAGRVHFERQAYWAQRPCVYWVDDARAPLPRRLLPGVWMLRRQQPGYMRLARGELEATIGSWPLEGPQSWEQRKWERIVRSRLLAAPMAPKQRR